MRELEIKLQKQNLTRWNSILFMIRSVLRLTPEHFKKIRTSMIAKLKGSGDFKKRETIRNFTLSDEERRMLTELVELLECFEFVTNQLQTNKVSISKVIIIINI